MDYKRAMGARTIKRDQWLQTVKVVGATPILPTLFDGTDVRVQCATIMPFTMLK
jgi:hypothetical protein